MNQITVQLRIFNQKKRDVVVSTVQLLDTKLKLYNSSMTSKFACHLQASLSHVRIPHALK